jgi:large subunit ribosomal protein L29
MRSQAQVSKLIAGCAQEEFMKAEKIRNLTDEELRHQEQEMSDQLFKLKFQLNMGQTESLKKLRGLRKDIARVKTIAGERAAAGEKK